MPWWIPLLVVLQVTIPTVALIAPDKPNPGGFQMYSGLGGYEVTVRDTRGKEINHDPSDLLVNARPEIDWANILPTRACAAVPGAATVTFRTAHASETTTC